MIVEKAADVILGAPPPEPAAVLILEDRVMRPRLVGPEAVAAARRPSRTG